MTCKEEDDCARESVLGNLLFPNVFTFIASLAIQQEEIINGKKKWCIRHVNACIPYLCFYFKFA